MKEIFITIEMSKLPVDVYCFNCGGKFKKKDPLGYEECPLCGKGFNDLSKDSQFAVRMVMKTMIEHFRS